MATSDMLCGMRRVHVVFCLIHRGTTAMTSLDASCMQGRDHAGQPDEECADAAWASYLQNNDSVIVDQFAVNVVKLRCALLQPNVCDAKGNYLKG